MICVLVLLSLNGTVLERELKVEQVIVENEYNYKIKYRIPKDVMVHYYNRGIQIVSKDKCKKEEL